MFSIFIIIFTKMDSYIKMLFYIIYFIIIAEIFFSFKSNILIFFTSIIYIFISFICFKLYFEYYFIKEILIFTIFLVIIFDISCYFFGSNFGKLKILPNVSPNKTYFGLISGFVTTFIFGYLLNAYYLFLENKLVIIFIFFTLIAAFFGDIVESVLKRKIQIKNSGKFIPGHGGFFDRFDSMIMVVIWLFAYHLIY